MNGFEYKYNTPNDILQNILLLQDTSAVAIGVFCGLFILYWISVLYFVPALNSITDEYVKRYKAKKRKDFIRQIAIQKDIEDKIMQEIDAH
jgi:hypothetical protein